MEWASEASEWNEDEGYLTFIFWENGKTNSDYLFSVSDINFLSLSFITKILRFPHF